MYDQKGWQYDAQTARKYAEMTITILRPFIERFEIAGSLRRKKQTVHDVDIVMKVKPGELENLKNSAKMIIESNQPQPADEIKLGDKIIRFKVHIKDTPEIQPPLSIDLYLADTDSVFDVLTLIRTGSEQHNIRLAMKAKQLGGSLKVGGEGLVIPEKQQDGSVVTKTYTKEEDILKCLLGKVPLPEERN